MKSSIKFQTILLIAMLFAVCSYAWAGPPFITDDPEPVQYQQWEVNYAISQTWRQTGTSVGVPGVDINYGFSPNIQLHAQPGYAYAASGANQHFGINNTEIGLKYRFIDGQYASEHWLVAIYPMLQLPTGNTKLGDTQGKVQAFLPLWIQRNSGDWIVYGGMGYRINRAVDSRNSLFAGMATLYRINDQWQLGGEVFHETSAAIAEVGHSGFNAGGTYSFTDNCHVLFSAGKGLSNVAASNQFSAYLALQLIY